MSRLRNKQDRGGYGWALAMDIPATNVNDFEQIAARDASMRENAARKA